MSEARKDALREAVTNALFYFTEELTEKLTEDVFKALGPDGQLQLRQAREIADLKEAFWKALQRVKVLEDDILKLDVQLAQARKLPLDTTAGVGLD